MKFLAFNVRPDEREHFEETAARLGADIVLRDDTPSLGNADAVKGMDGLSIITQPVSAALLEAWAARGIRAVSTRTVGFDHIDLAAFIMLGDAELTVAAATELLKKCPEFDILLTAEAKGIPLAHEMSRQSGKPYICARKGEKLYMADPVVVEDQSITTAGKQKLVIDRKELDKMNGKRVLVVDDVISTGGSLKALDALAEQTQCTIVGQAAVLAEGDAAERKDIIFLEPLPLFFH